MFCRKCLKENKKVNMTVDIKNGKYTCPECEHEVEWDHKDKEE